MGNYNPHAPYILGQEWVPIRDENTVFSPAVNSVELGHHFTLATTRQVSTAKFYINELQAASDRGQTFMAAVYSKGTEDQSGPISQLLIPVNAVILTNATVDPGAPSAADALLTQSTSLGISLDVSQPNTGLALSFGISGFYPVLNAKRILDATMLLGVAASDDIVGPTRNTSTSLVKLSTTSTIGSTADPEALFGRLTVNGLNPIDFGEINQFWTANAPNLIADRMPWTFSQLVRLDSTATQIYARIESGTNRGTTANSSLFIYYAALQVTYCEEKRLLVGATQFGTSNASHSFGAESVLGQNSIEMHDLSGNLNPNLTSGDYLVTLSSADVGGLNDNQAQTTSDYPNLNAVREFYGLAPQTGLELDLPFPLDEHLGDVFSSQVVHILPQLSLHASGAALTEPHAYGRQAAAQIYGSITATQEIYDDISGVAANYPQVRYYARRFGDTTIPLTLTGTGGLIGSTASITVTEFDQLPEILNGWKEVTLRFSVAPVMGTVTGTPGWTWSAAGETSGNRWEILAASAPAVSGIGGNLFKAAPQQVATATYQPPVGDTVELTWMPQGVATPYVTGVSADAATDAVLIFSQDPATITGIGLMSLTQSVTGVAYNCGGLACCIPSGIGYHQITWSASSLPSTGFGAYELQRWDNYVSDFQTIMLCTDPTVLTFNDFEARVGTTSVYRIRTLNVLNFAGLWSTYVSGTPVAPGITGSCNDETGALIFTSNAEQAGAKNAAYIMQWDNVPNEDFTLPEAGFVQFQPMYGRDGAVAFHGTERGLETFTRNVLIQAGALSPAVLGNVTTIRDLAWDQIPYVCVRDGRGNRWFANVRVPSISARNDAQNYMARLDITELTRTPYPVDP